MHVCLYNLSGAAAAAGGAAAGVPRQTEADPSENKTMKKKNKKKNRKNPDTARRIVEALPRAHRGAQAGLMSSAN
jgi:hypothetical protein